MCDVMYRNTVIKNSTDKVLKQPYTRRSMYRRSVVLSWTAYVSLNDRRNSHPHKLLSHTTRVIYGDENLYPVNYSLTVSARIVKTLVGCCVSQYFEIISLALSSL